MSAQCPKFHTPHRRRSRPVGVARPPGRRGLAAPHPTPHAHIHTLFKIISIYIEKYF
ncbi:MAG: hypothetical protein F6J93_13870 [Oscillatoria sp. SIO1A7]|nr:hypothetical protein [Oscillatoria sp. SIO1A7]